MFHICFGGTGKDNVGSDYKNGPKRCHMCRLGTRCIHFLSLRVFLLTIYYIYRFYLCFGGMRKDWVGSDYKNGPKRCQMHCLGTRCVHFFFFMFFYILTTRFILYIGSIHVLEACERAGWAANTKTGPNDARCVVWALGVFIFCLFVFFY